MLSGDRYGKTDIRVMKTRKEGATHYVQDMTVAVIVDASKTDLSYTHEDNSFVVPTDTIKNTVYYVANQHATIELEKFGAAICEHFMKQYAHFNKVSVTIKEDTWQRIVVKGKPEPYSFTRGGPEKYVVQVEMKRGGKPQFTSGVRDFYLFKTTGSMFVDFHRCKWTTLKDDRDRLLKTALEARWNFNTDNVDYRQVFSSVKNIAAEVFSKEYSKSVQGTLFHIGQQIIRENPAVESIWLSAPNLHNWKVDLSPFGVPSNNSVFNPPDDPKGHIECIVSRSKSPRL
eukprot:TRINITY_DN7410_c0_g1_i1.p1 TRINITY_DN7410_c0_g1~~TRINITY_DN7410_c0_g1_i1.p1  ORF type:complete len:286 (-),score=42.50 TRINITY_DN7410_c0_g1_i1:15-872(-)